MMDTTVLEDAKVERWPRQIKTRGFSSHDFNPSWFRQRLLMLAYLIGDVLPWDYSSHDGTPSLFLRDRHFIGRPIYVVSGAAIA